MKNKIKFIYKSLFLACFFQLFVFCESQLGALPENAKVDGNTVLDEATAKIALNGVYYRFANVSASNNITQWTINERLPAQLSGYMVYGYGVGAGAPEDNQMLSSSSTYWQYSYGIINAANSLIGAMNGLPEGRIPQKVHETIEAETRFLRAYGNYKLLSYYSQWFDYDSQFGVLLRDEAVTTGNIAKSRSTVKESYEAILNDLDFAIEHAPKENSKYYATSAAAKVLKARVLISRGQLGDYQEVISLSDEVIAQGEYRLEPLAKDIFRILGEESDEVILSITPQPNQPDYAYSRTRQFYPGASSLYCATEGLNNLLEGDPRQDWMVGSFRPDYANFFFTKYIAEGNNPSVVSETFFAMRLTEVYLLKAEAILRNKGSIDEAKAILKKIGEHNGLQDFSKLESLDDYQELLLYNYHEVSKCLVAEDGQEWLTLLRLPLSTVSQLRPKLTEINQYILPIPNGEFADNPEFGEQNPGYNIDL
ncbi:MAG TPA: RagB/SusD family nutrient uptake outer membrane protein [Candidatus Sphingobacterium stercoripullorum]|uniref:RagB/SusD family nutrient uptake outer membrane protein n=1 Tax=Candidatus Sphingobacterium stercoripullorum TaxID=2838759 RepID=A0A9D1W6L9_9SPHI|nr:RagB/SusD family nutrient uptake outer membrane protein [Candidatus Sphingobacterium stercoripullorum]